MNVTFCGHKQIAEKNDFSKWLDDILSALIECGAKNFYMGGYGDFDKLAAWAVQRQKAVHDNIVSILVLAYPNRKYEKDLYDKAIYPALERVPSRFAIIKSNQFMVNQSDVVISGVVRSNGGAAQTLAYARQNKKLILQYPFYSLS